MRSKVGGYCYHVLSRGHHRQQIFHHGQHYEQFVRLMHRATERIPLRVLGFCLMPNHFHFVVWPRETFEMSRWMHWLLTSHAARYRAVHHPSGAIWQGRSKSFAVQQDEHLFTVLRYVERNPLRAGLGKEQNSGLGPMDPGDGAGDGAAGDGAGRWCRREMVPTEI